MKQVHAEVASDPQTLRISFDSKAKVKVGDFSRGGRARSQAPVRAADHDMQPCAVLVPVGILEVDANQLTVVLGTSNETSDLHVDSLDLWWAGRQPAYPQVRRLLIDLDNGPHNSSVRTQFMKRMVGFADRTGLTVELVYYPPYHSKYNVIERCWGILENHWNGTILSSVETVKNWAKTMTWRGVRPIVHLLDRFYPTGVRLTPKEFRPVAVRLNRSSSLPKWHVIIQPEFG